MKISKLIAGFGFAILGGIAVSASAQTTVPSGCTWTYVSNQSGPTGTILITACKLNGVTLATREQKYNSHSAPSCSITSVAAGYVSSGSCDNAQILKMVTTVATTSCNTGATTIFQTGPGTPPFNVAAFCGTGCPYSVQPQSPYSFPPLKYTCL